MKNMDSKTLRNLWRDFYKERGHKIIGSASVIPENDPSVLFTTAGMHPLVPYLLGQPHPEGKRLCNVQKCIRTGDIDEVGDASHCTFFEMLGNWSLGDYFKKEKIALSYEFLTKYLNINTDNLAVSVFKGDENCPVDEVSASAWLEKGIKKENIFYLDKKHNWWGPVGNSGPCGPDSEMFMITAKEKCSLECSPACSCGRYLEIGNDVFMEYYKNEDGSYSPLKQKNVDTGMGMERLLMILNGKKSVYETDVFAPIINQIERLGGQKYGINSDTDKAMRIVADHIRTAVHMIGDEKGIVCSNVDQGYVLRRLIRRAVRFANKLNINAEGVLEVARCAIEVHAEEYPCLSKNRQKILDELAGEQERFEKTLHSGLKEFEKLAHYLVGDTISGKAAFKLYDTYGFPIEISEEIAAERGLKIDNDGFKKALDEHRQKSQSGAEQKFKGGLVDAAEQTTRLHTATHLLHQALKTVLNDDGVNQKGSNITHERLRFDFSFHRPLTEEEISAVEKLVNEQIQNGLDVLCEQMSVEDAKKANAIGLFEDKYGQTVKVYSIGGFSKEICGGPHVNNTRELGKFSIAKEQSSSAGVRRIKGVLENDGAAAESCKNGGCLF